MSASMISPFERVCLTFVPTPEEAAVKMALEVAVSVLSVDLQPLIVPIPKSAKRKIAASLRFFMTAPLI